MLSPTRLLGFAFANADLLFEIDATGTITFATGAVSAYSKGRKLTGASAASLFDMADGIKFVTFAKSLTEGSRAGPLNLKLADGRAALVAFCRLPHTSGTISCTLSCLQGTGFNLAANDIKTGLTGRDEFLKTIVKLPDDAGSLTLIDVPGLPDACASLPADASDRLLTRIGEVVRQASPTAAGRLTDTTFGAVSAVGKPLQLGSEISQLLNESGLGTARVAQTMVPLAGGELSAEQRLLVLNHVVSRFAAGEIQTESTQDLATSFAAVVTQTQERALALTDRVLAGEFKMAFQPVVRFSTTRPDYFEALARFGAADNTKDIVTFAEDLRICDVLDVTVTAKVLQEAQNNRDVHLAINLSGLSFSTPSVFGLLLGMLAAKRDIAPRVRIELTETAQITDFETASQALKAVRTLGFKVGLDDFGAGAASFQYLRAFEIDFVKFGVSLIRNIGKTRREDRLIAGLVKLCREMGIETVAEGIENQLQLDKVRTMGFDLGQGWHLGKPTAQLPKLAAPPKLNLHRKGERETWA